MHEWAPAGKDRKYARVERERRFLLRSVPGLSSVRTVEIRDRYLHGSRIRLRAATTVEGDGEGSTYYKLTQKVPSPGGGPGLITTFYLDPSEYRLFDSLPGGVLRKKRRSMPPFGVDHFMGSLEGLVLAEVEFDSDAGMSAFDTPPWMGAEVTSDPAFSGGRLVQAGRQDVRRALAVYGVDLPTPTHQIS